MNIYDVTAFLLHTCSSQLICVWCSPDREMSQCAVHLHTLWLNGCCFLFFLTNEQRFFIYFFSWSCQIFRLLPSFHYTHNLIRANCFLSPTWCKLNQTPTTVRYTQNLLVLSQRTSLIVSMSVNGLYVGKNIRREVMLWLSGFSNVIVCFHVEIKII